MITAVKRIASSAAQRWRRRVEIPAKTEVAAQ
jgi:hypothetical protein